MSNVISLVSVLIVTILILYLSYVFTRLLGKGMVIKRGGSCMQQLDRLPLGQDKAVSVVRAGNHYYLIGITSSQITLLAELQEEDIKNELSELPSQTEEGQTALNFKEILGKFADRHKKGL